MKLLILSQLPSLFFTGLRRSGDALQATKVLQTVRFCAMMGMSFYAQGCRQAQRGKRQRGKWEHVRHAGVETVVRRHYKGWQIEISSRAVGITIPRDQFSAVIRLDDKTSHYLQNFSSKKAALEAAQQHIDLREDTKQSVLPGPHQPAKRPSSDRK